MNNTEKLLLYYTGWLDWTRLNVPLLLPGPPCLLRFQCIHRVYTSGNSGKGLVDRVCCSSTSSLFYFLSLETFYHIYCRGFHHAAPLLWGHKSLSNRALNHPDLFTSALAIAGRIRTFFSCRLLAPVWRRHRCLTASHQQFPHMLPLYVCRPTEPRGSQL